MMQTLKLSDEKLPDFLLKLKINQADVAEKSLSMSALIQWFLDQKQYTNAMLGFVWGLPFAEAAWWICLCLNDREYQPELSSNAKTILQQVSSWVKTPTNENVLKDIDEVLQHDKTISPAAWLGRAVIWYGGNIADEADQRVEADDHMPILAMHNAIEQAMRSAKNQAQYCQQSVKRGLHIALGGNGQLTA